MSLRSEVARMLIAELDGNKLEDGRRVEVRSAEYDSHVFLKVVNEDGSRKEYRVSITFAGEAKL